MKPFIIFAPSYSEISGGAVAMHKLCHLINSLGGKAFLFPMFESFYLNQINFRRVILRMLHRHLKSSFSQYKVHGHWETPVITKLSSEVDLSNSIVVYPEITFGNPLNAPYVVRWMLHNPGFHKGTFYYGTDELHFKFNTAIQDFNYPRCTLWKDKLEVIHYPLDLYNEIDTSPTRSGRAYCIRKGRNRVRKEDLSDGVIIDGMSHQDVARTLKSVEQFISYDTYTAYSKFAALCGCDSIVIPEDGVDITDWYSDPADRLGVAYGFEEIEWARKTRQDLKAAVAQQHERSAEDVKRFLLATESFFSVK